MYVVIVPILTALYSVVTGLRYHTSHACFHASLFISDNFFKLLWITYFTLSYVLDFCTVTYHIIVLEHFTKNVYMQKIYSHHNAYDSFECEVFEEVFELEAKNNGGKEK